MSTWCDHPAYCLSISINDDGSFTYTCGHCGYSWTVEPEPDTPQED